MNALLNKPLPTIPPEIRTRLAQPCITQTSFEDRNAVLCDAGLQREVGYTRFPDGNWLVSMTCSMPGITADMIRWWFWWHCREDLRYRVWFPGDHLRIRYHKKDRDYFLRDTLPPFQPNTQFPVEKIGSMRLPLRIDFVTPEQFGFRPEDIRANHISLVVCGHVSAFGGLLPHTEMAHIFKQTEDGLLLISRFWLGQTLKNPLLRKAILTEDTALGMAEHCCVEYRNLAEILPGLYRKYAK